VGGTIIASGNIFCGTLGSSCSADVPDGKPVTLRVEADSGFSLSQFTGDCAPSGDTTMTTARSCGATFLEAPGRINHVPAPAQPDRPQPRVPVEPKANNLSPNLPPTGTSPTPPVTNPAPSGQTPTPPTPTVPTGPDAKAPPPETAEVHAKKEIADLIKKYCSAYETMKPAEIKKWYPQANERDLKEQFKQYKSVRCAVTPPKDEDYAQFEVRDAGAAQFTVAMKQEIETKIDGPKKQETLVTVKVSRTDQRSAWFIDWVRHKPKPKE
jgi:hypothetical protein